MSSPPSPCIRAEHGSIRWWREAVRSDIHRFASFNPDYQPRMSLKTTLSILLQPSILCIAVHRFAHYLHVRGWRRMAGGLSNVVLVLFKANIPARSCIGLDCFLGHPAGTTFIGTAGRGLTLFSVAVCSPETGSPKADPSRMPHLGDGVTVGAHAGVVGPVRIGNDVQIATMTRVDEDCPDDALVYSRRLRPRFVIRQPPKTV